MKKPILIDVREYDEFDAIPPLPESCALPMSKYKEWIKKLSKDEEYLIICHTNNRSSQVALWMQMVGFKAKHMQEGMSVLTGDADCGPCQLLRKEGIK